MQYVLLIYEDEAVYGGPERHGEALSRVAPGHRELVRTLGPRRLAGAGLKGTGAATTVRTHLDGSKVVHDGPFAETKEQLGGFYLIEADTLEEAIAIARRVPLAREGAVEIRPLLEVPPDAG
jgi:hypothetical protein